MTDMTPDAARPISIEYGPLDIQLVDLRLASHEEIDYPEFNILKVAVWIACGHHRAGDKPTLMGVGEESCWDLPIPLDQDARTRLLQIRTVARDLYGVRVRLAAEIELIAERLALLTVWPVAEQYAPGARPVVVCRGYLVPVS
jgi:hypothetical protein